MAFSVTTKTGDKGETGLVGGRRVSKASARIHAYGTVDELNAILGVIIAEEVLNDECRIQLTEVQRILFHVGADLATPIEQGITSKNVESSHTEKLEQWANVLEQALPVQKRFILPSGSRIGSMIHLGRTVCRRAERWVVELSLHEAVNTEVIMFLNRLSDYLFLLSRTVNKAQGVAETDVTYD